MQRGRSRYNQLQSAGLTRCSSTSCGAPGLAAAPKTWPATATCTPLALVQTLLIFEQVADDVDAHIGQARVRRHHDARPVLTRHRHQRRAPALAVPDGPLAATAAGEDGALLAPPLRHRLQQDRRHVRRRARHQDDGRRAAERRRRLRGQIQLFRDLATGNFRDLLIEVAKDPAMLVWLDGRTNVRTRPQENFARELMELFTTGIGHYTEDDVYAAARVFTGWNLELAGDRADQVNSYYRFVYNAGQHDTNAKEFTFEIYPEGAGPFRRDRRARGCRTASI